MIVTVTPNAAVDKAYKLAHPVQVGEVQRVETCIDTAGGKGLNCARAIAAAGGTPVASGFVGGTTGAYIEELLDGIGLDHEFVHVKGQTRCCINALGPDGSSTEFLEAGAPVTEKDVEKLEKKVESLLAKADAVTLNGSVPAGMKDYSRLIKAAKDAGKPVFLDTSGEALRSGIAEAPTFVKPNADEIEFLCGKMPSSIEEVAAAAKELHAAGIAYAVVSLGAKGAVLACEKGTYYGHAPKVEAVNTVGSGDTFVGTFAVALLSGSEPKDCLAYALSCASANCLSASTGSFVAARANELMNQAKIEDL